MFVHVSTGRRISRAAARLAGAVILIVPALVAIAGAPLVGASWRPVDRGFSWIFASVAPGHRAPRGPVASEGGASLVPPPGEGHRCGIKIVCRASGAGR